MSIGTLFGFVLAFGLIVGSIIASTDKASMFVNYPSLLIVVGGTIAAGFISYEFKTAVKALKIMGWGFKKHKDSTLSLKDQIGFSFLKSSIKFPNMRLMVQPPNPPPIILAP